MLLAVPQVKAGPPLWVLPVIIGGVVLCGIVLLLLALRKRSRAPKEMPCASCGRVIPAAWDKCRFCGAATRELKAELKFISGPLVGRSVNLGEREVTTIGSAPENTVPLTDTGVSRKHVGIRKGDGGFELADSGIDERCVRERREGGATQIGGGRRDSRRHHRDGLPNLIF